MTPPIFRARRFRAAFTLVEVLLSTAILGLLITLFATIISQTSSLWKRTTGKVEQFREARNGFERMTTVISQATLNTYWDYDDPLAPKKYERRSELRFISGPAKTLLVDAKFPTHAIFFQAPRGITDTSLPTHAGFENLLSTTGFYLEFNSDENLRPPFIKPSIAPLRYRSRLMELLQNAESKETNIYASTSGPGMARSYTGKNWFQKTVQDNAKKTSASGSRVLAENIIAMVITPRLSVDDERTLTSGGTSLKSAIAPNYLYDSSSAGAAATAAAVDKPKVNSLAQLPPIVQVTMVAIDEATAARLATSTKNPFETALQTKFLDGGKYVPDLLIRDPKTGVESPDSLETLLAGKRANYRIFTTNVTIRGAKWSREQK